jgi:SEC-C motif
MATEAQIAANRNNAQASTGATTPAGKVRASLNAVSSGLYSRGDFVLPDEQAQYVEFCASFQTDLQPEGAIEQTLSAEIIHAAWRLRRCSAVAVGMARPLDPMVDPATAQTQQAVDRARNDAHRAFQRSIAELRRLQTERQFRTQSFPEEFDLTTLGIASFKDMAPALMTDTQRQLLRQKLRLAAQHTMVPNRDRQGAATPDPGHLNAEANHQPEPLFTNRSQSGIGQTPRNSPCTCGSGIKFKRCCGKGAPAVLNLAA